MIEKLNHLFGTHHMLHTMPPPSHLWTMDGEILNKTYILKRTCTQFPLYLQNLHLLIIISNIIFVDFTQCCENEKKNSTHFWTWQAINSINQQTGISNASVEWKIISKFGHWQIVDDLQQSGFINDFAEYFFNDYTYNLIIICYWSITSTPSILIY